MMIKKIAAAAALVVAAVPAFAAIAPGSTGNGELFLAVFDNVAKVSYVKDLGVFQTAFKVAADGVDAGFTQSWSLAGDSNWATFAAASSTANTQWAMIGVDHAGGTGVGALRLYTTSLNTTANLANMAKYTNQLFSVAINAPLANFFAAINTTGTHGASGAANNYALNGSSVNFDPSNAYVGKAGSLNATYNTAAGNFRNSNAIGQESGFYYLTRSGVNQLNPILVDQFENSFAKATVNFTIDGAAPLLSYTLAAAVPEPSTYAMLLGGLIGIGFMARRRQG